MPQTIQREKSDNKWSFRAMPVSMDKGVPVTLDEATRSVAVIAATEAPVKVFDQDRWEIITEIALMSGCELPSNRQVPLLDTHNRLSTSWVIGSARELKTQGQELLCRVYYSSEKEAAGPYAKMCEGHLTDYSIGYRIEQSVWVEDGTTVDIEGRSFTGPVKVLTRWTPKELSTCPIGLDESAKSRADAPNNESAGHRSPAPTTEEHKMDEKLRKLLETRGLNKDTKENEAWIFMDNLLERGAADDSQPVDIQAEIMAERARACEIRAMCAKHGYEVKADTLVNDGKTVDEAREAVLAHLETRPAASPGFALAVGLDERDKFRSAAACAISMRSGISAESPAAGASELVGYSLRELARHSLLLSGEKPGGQPMEMVGRAMLSGDFPHILMDAANKSLSSGFQTAEETWNQWCATGSASDFKTNNIVSLSEADDLDEIGEHGDFTYGDRSDHTETYELATYGKLFSITRQTIINDDLSALTDIPLAHGEAAARKIGDIVYAVLTANAAMGDGKALFHEDHGNIGTGGVVSEITLGEAIKRMKLQQDLAGKRRLNIQPEFFIAPVTIEGAAETFFASNQFAGDDPGTTRTNIYAGKKIKRVYEARLDDSSATAFYLAGRKGKTIKVFFLNGNQTPYMETQNGWSVDGVEYKVRIDAAAKAISWKALVTNPGA